MSYVRTLLAKLGFEVDKGPLEDFNEEIDDSKGLLDDVKGKAAGLIDQLGKLNQAWEFTQKTATKAWDIFKGLTLSIAEQGAALSDTSAQVGVGTTELQRLQYAAEMTGSSADTVNKALLEQAKIMRETQANAASPFGTALKEIGLKLEDIDKLSPADRFGKIGEALSFVHDKGQQSALSLALFGGEGAKILPLALEGRAGLKALGDEAERLGFVLGEDVVEGGAKLDDTLLTIGKLVKGIQNDIGAALLPTISDLASELSEWIKANRELIAENVKGFVQGLIEAGKTLGPIIITAAKAVMGLVDALGGASTVIGPVTAGLGAMRLACLAALGPWGLLAAAGVAAGVAIASSLADAERRTLSLTKAAIRMKDSLQFEAGLGNKSVAELQSMKAELAKERERNRTIGGDVRGKTPAQIKKLNEERKLDVDAIGKREAALDAALASKVKSENQESMERMRETEKIRKEKIAKEEEASQSISDIEELGFLKGKRKKTDEDRARLAELGKKTGISTKPAAGGGKKAAADKPGEKQKTAEELVLGTGAGVLGSDIPGAGTKLQTIIIDIKQANSFGPIQLPGHAASSPENFARAMMNAATPDLDAQNQKLASYLQNPRSGAQ